MKVALEVTRRDFMRTAALLSASSALGLQGIEVSTEARAANATAEGSCDWNLMTGSRDR